MSNFSSLLDLYQEQQQNIISKGVDFAAMLKQVQAFQAKRIAETHPELFGNSKTKHAAEFLFLGLYKDDNLRHMLTELCDKASALSIIPSKVLGSLLHTVEVVTDTDKEDHQITNGLLNNNIQTLTLESYLESLRENSTHKARLKQFNQIKILGKSIDDTLRGRMLKSAVKLARKPMKAAGFKATHEFIMEGFELTDSVKDVEELTRKFSDQEIIYSEKAYGGDKDPYTI